MTPDQKFRTLVRTLRQRFPPLLPVRVYRRVDLGENLGDTALVSAGPKPSHFVVRIKAAMPWQTTQDVLLHEWAHTVAWCDGHQAVQDHGPEWALAYGRLYQGIITPHEIIDKFPQAE